MQVKIGDFGLSRALQMGKSYYQTNFNANLRLPIAWCALEAIHDLRFTSASDVWSYGVTLWEVFTYGFTPWAGFSGKQILEAVDLPNSRRLGQPDACPDAVFDAVMRACWNHEPNSRPTFAQLTGKSLLSCLVQLIRSCMKKIDAPCSMKSHYQTKLKLGMS